MNQMKSSKVKNQEKTTQSDQLQFFKQINDYLINELKYQQNAMNELSYVLVVNKQQFAQTAPEFKG